MTLLEQYKQEHADWTYTQLLQEREKLLKDIYYFENGQLNKISNVKPSPADIYKQRLLQLAVIIVLLDKAFEKEFIQEEEGQ